MPTFETYPHWWERGYYVDRKDDRDKDVWYIYWEGYDKLGRLARWTNTLNTIPEKVLTV